MPNKNDNNKNEKRKNNNHKHIQKAKKELEVNIIEEINDSMKQEITEEIVQDIKNAFDKEYKDGLKNEIKTELIDDIKKDIQKEQRKLSRSKSFKIFRLYLYFFVVVACLFYLIYRLYVTDNLNVINEKYTKKTTTTTKLIETDVTEPIQDTVKDLNYYIEHYGYLLDNLKISNVELVNGKYSVEDISLSDRLTMAYGSLDSSDILIDGLIYSVSADRLSEAYKKIFGSIDEYIETNFVVRGLSFTYSVANDCYMAIGNEDTSMSYVSHVLLDIKEEGNDLIFSTKAYVIKNGSIYSAKNLNYRLGTVTDNFDITSIQNMLSSVEYRFTASNNGYRLVSISKK